MTKTNLILSVLVFLCGFTTVFTLYKIFTPKKIQPISSAPEITLAPTSVPSPLPTAIIKPKPAAVLGVNTSLCLITIQGKQYNVTSLRSRHSGGDIFKCGTDMTAIYQNQHGSSLSQIQPYLYTPGSTPAIQNPKNIRDDDD